MTDTEIEPEVLVKTITENYATLKATIEALNLDYEKFNEKKVKAAGARVRNNLLNCKKLCDKLRKQVLLDIKALPIKRRLSPDLQPLVLHSKNADITKEEDVEEIADNILPLELVRETTSAIVETPTPAPKKEKRKRKSKKIVDTIHPVITLQVNQP
jgi:hypothetical protein